jgi:hypothetical protein
MLYHGYAKNLLDIASGVLVVYATYKKLGGFFQISLKLLYSFSSWKFLLMLC